MPGATIAPTKVEQKLRRDILGGKRLTAITGATVGKIAEAKLAKGCSNATVNRTLALVRAILRKCANEWEWLDRAPKVHMLKEPKRRIRFLTQQEARRLLAELPEHLADMAAFSLATGLRAANVTGLQWSQVDLVRKLAWVHPDQGEGPQGHCRTAERGGAAACQQTAGQAHDTRVQLQRHTNAASQHQSLVRGAQAGWDRGLPLA
jgi:integrase